MGGQCWTKQGKPKRRDVSRRDAKKARRWYIENLGNDPGQPYVCAVCQWFHLGHYPTSKVVRQRLRERHRSAAS